MKNLDALAKTLSQAVIKHLARKIDQQGDPSVTFNHYKHEFLRPIIMNTKGHADQIKALAGRVKLSESSELRLCLNEPFLKDAVAAKIWAQLLIHLHEHYLTILEYEVVESEAAINHLKKLADIKNSKITSH